MQMVIDFCVDTHTYTVDGIVLPSVTQIISTLIDREQYYAPGSADRGTYIHERCAELTNGTLNHAWLSSNEPEIYAYVYQWSMYLDDYNLTGLPAITERAYANTVYAGTVDYYCPVKSYLVDIKTGIDTRQSVKCAELQLIAYNNLIGQKIDNMQVVYISQNKYKVYNLSGIDKYDASTQWQSLLNIYNLKKKLQS
jgi:hypothetical protein